MTEKREYLKSRFIYPECANELLRQFRFKSAEEVRDAIEHAERQSEKNARRK